MKKKLLLMLTLLVGAAINLNGQVLFYEDFDGVSGITAGGAGTYTFPAGWMLRNVDNRTPAGGVSYVNEAWERREDFNFSVADSCAFSTSWYLPVGAADDWMWTPLIGPLPAFSKLTWNAVTYDVANPDGYEVRIMTSTQGPPTGGAGVMGNQVTNSTQIFTIATESTTWTPRSVDLNAYTGQSVYIAFRNNSNDKFILLIDDVKVEVMMNYDAQVLNAKTYEYSITPLLQLPLDTLEADVKNLGISAITNVSLATKVYDQTNTMVFNGVATPLATLAPSASAHFKIPGFAPATAGIYTIKYYPVMTETEQNAVNDTTLVTRIFDNQLYARDDGMINGALGIGAGNGGYLGQTYKIVAPQELGSIDVYYTRGYATEKLGAVIWNIAAGVPDTIMLYSDTLVYPDDSARLYHFPLVGGPAVLAPGDYAVTVIEFDSLVQIGMSPDIFTTGTTWVNWPTSPTGTWAHNESFGGAFSKSYAIRLNFFSCDLVANTIFTEASCLLCDDGTATLNYSGGTPPFEILWSNGETTPTIDSLMEGEYIVTISDYYNCSITDTVVVSYSSVSIEEKPTLTMHVTPNPSQGEFSVELDEKAEVSICDLQGKILFTQTLAEGKSNLSLSLPKGLYVLKALNDKGMRSMKLVIH